MSYCMNNTNIRIFDYSNNKKTQRGCDYPELCDKTLLEIF